MSVKARSLCIVIGSNIVLLGLLLPWYSVSFLPPTPFYYHGQGIEILLDLHNGFNQFYDPSVHLIVWNAIALYFLGLIYYRFGTGGTVVSLIIRVLMMFIHLWQVILAVYNFFTRIIAQKTLALEQQNFAQTYGGGPAAQQASQYVKVTVLFGFWVLVVGILLAAVGLYIGGKDTTTYKGEIGGNLLAGLIIFFGGLMVVAIISNGFDWKYVLALPGF